MKKEFHWLLIGQMNKKEMTVKVISRENEVILFDGSIRHRSVTKTDNNRRVNININYLINNSKD